MNKQHYFVLLVIALLGITVLFVRHSSKQSAPSGLSIKKPETLIVGTSADYEPYTFKQAGGIPEGFDIDVVKEIAKRLNRSIEIKDIPLTALIPEIQLGSIHLIAAGIGPTPERSERVFFTRPYYEGKSLVIVSPIAGERFESLESLNNNRVIVNTGFISEQLLMQRPTIELLRLPTVSQAFLALQDKQADAFFSGQEAIEPFLEGRYGRQNYHVTPIQEARETIALAVSKRHPTLLPQIQEALDDMAQDGTIVRLQDKWGLAHD